MTGKLVESYGKYSWTWDDKCIEGNAISYVPLHPQLHRWPKG